MRKSASFFLACSLAACAAPHRLDDFPDTIQANDYSCGVAAVQAVLQFYDQWGYADEYAREMGTTPEEGTHPGRMVECLRKRGLDARLVEGLTVDDLRRRVDEGVPVIVDFQAWGEKQDYSREWEDGHYAVVVGYEGETFILEDPSLLGQRGTLTAAELESRWRDYETENGKRREYVRAGIVVRGPKTRPASRVPIE